MKTLIIIDVQNDFLPGGALAVPGGAEIMTVINRIMSKFDHIFATQDWHPPGHVSFKSAYGPWPDHCVQNTEGAKLSNQLHKEKIEKVFQKGTDPRVDSYSAFFDEKRRPTGFSDYLQKHHLKDLYFVGLATDYCVYHTVLDALELGFNVWVIEDACRAIGDQKKAIETMRVKGAKIIQSNEL